MPLSSVDSDQERLGLEAAALLDHLMNGEKPPPEPIRVPPKGVVTRQSTDILAIPHIEVARALRTILEQYTEPITAQAVAVTVPMSERCLHDAFVKYVGRTMAQEVARRRVELARKLLEESGEKLAAPFVRAFHFQGNISLAHPSGTFMSQPRVLPLARNSAAWSSVKVHSLSTTISSIPPWS